MKQRGVTLIELIVAMGISVGILGAAYACLRTGFESRKLVEARSELGRRARITLQLIAADLKRTVPLDQERPFLGLSRSIGDIEADNIDFGSLNHVPQHPGEGEFCELSYFLDGSIQGPGFSLFRRKDTSPDDKRLEGGTREELCEGLRAFHVEYYDGAFWESNWGDDPERSDSPNVTNGDANAAATSPATNTLLLPVAVRVTLVFDDPLSDPAESNPDSGSSGRQRSGRRGENDASDAEFGDADFDSPGFGANEFSTTHEFDSDPFGDNELRDREQAGEESSSDDHSRPPLVYSRVIYLELANYFNEEPQGSTSASTGTNPGRTP